MSVILHNELPPAPPLEKVGLHYDVLAKKVAPLLEQGAAIFLEHLPGHTQLIPPWYETTRTQRLKLHYHLMLNQRSLTEVSAVLDKVGTVEAFASRTLEPAMQARWHYTPDVHKNVFVRTTHEPAPVEGGWIYIADANIDDFIRIQRYPDSLDVTKTETQTLLQAALHNFEQRDTVKGAFEPGSGLLKSRSSTAPDNVLPIPPEHFAAFVRNLNIGEQYQQHLEGIFFPSDSLEKATLEQTFIQQERHSLLLQADIAYLKKDISEAVHTCLINFGSRPGTLTLNGQPFIYEHLELDRTGLNTVIAFHASDLSIDPRCILYIPGDPVSCLKEYANKGEAHRDLLNKLSDKGYRGFFIHLTAQRYSLQLLKRLNARFEHGTHDPLRFDEVQPAQEFFRYMYEARVEKLFDDACFIAVPTAQTDRVSLIERLEHYVETGMTVLNVAAFFVPGLGEAMMAVFAAQLLTDTFHGIEAWEQDEKKQAWSYTQSVLLNIVIAAGIGKVASALGKAPEIIPSALVEELDAVQMPGGETRLWKPDLAPFEHDISLPHDLRPDEQGLLQHEGHTYLPLENKLYRVQMSSDGQYRLMHPTDPDAYRPLLSHNGQGAWKNETESLSEWDRATLVRRLEPSFAGLSDEQAEDLLRINQIEEPVLRQLYIDGLPPPALLQDTIDRFHIDQELRFFIRQMRAGELNADPQTQLQLLTQEDMWPATKVLRFIGEDGHAVAEYGNRQVSRVPVVQVLDVQLREGNLLKTVLEVLDESEVSALLGHTPVNLEVRTEALRMRIVQSAEQHFDKLFTSRYQSLQNRHTPLQGLLTKAFPALPVCAAQELINAARSAEYWQLLDAGQIPLRLAEEASLYLEELRLSHAYEGARFNTVHNPDTQKLILHSLEHMPGWSDQITLEVREHSFHGPIIDRVGAPEAPIRKILVKEGDRYQTFSDLEEHLHGSDDLYASVLHALPDEQRNALGFPHTWQGPALKEALAQQPLMPRRALRALLKMPPERDASSPMKLAKGREGYPRPDAGTVRCRRSPLACFGRPPRKILRLMEELYPSHTPDVVQDFLGLENLTGRAALTRLENLKDEFSKLCKSLDAWVAEPPDWISVSEHHIRHVRVEDKRRVALAIKRCWQRLTRRIRLADGTELGHELKIDGISVGQLPALAADFSHVSSLQFKNLYLGNDFNLFLEHFPSLRWLNLESAGLEQLPVAIGNMPHLTKLYLSGNRIALTPDTARVISRMSTLKILELNDNPLGVVPDFTALTDLRLLRLRNTRINHWPQGIETLPELHTVDLRENRISTLPDAYFQMSASRIDNLLLHDNPLTNDMQREVDSLRERLGSHSVARTHAPESNDPVNLWLRDESAPAALDQKKALWHKLVAEPDSAAFFGVIKDLVISPGYHQARSVLAGRVWRVLEAAGEDTGLREQLFAAAVENETCVDRATTVFSRMGFKVLLHEAARLEGSAKELEILKLMKGHLRLLQLNDIAQTQIALQQARYQRAIADQLPSAEIGRLKPDPLEVQLIYQVDLAERLELPWQPTHMQFREAAKIRPEQIEEAYRIVINQENKPGYLVNELLKQGVWVDHLEAAHGEWIKSENVRLDQQFEDLENLREKQALWADSTPGEVRSQLEADLKALALKLEIAEAKVFTGEPMTDATYNEQLLNIDLLKKDILRHLTRQALDAAAG